jgi:uncharacterized protein (TIGR03435 family)
MRRTSLIFVIVVLGSHPLQNARAQTPKLTFEVASIRKASDSETAIVSRPQGGRPGGAFDATGTVVRLVLSAFDVADFEVTGGPSWTRTDRFTISAKAGREASAAEMQVMLRALLEERFRLRTHFEQRQMTHHVLRVARSDGRLGAQLVKNTNECTSPRMKLSSVPSGAAAMSGCGPIEHLVRTTANMLEARVEDRAGLAGNFDFFLYAAPERPRSINGAAVSGELSTLQRDQSLPAYRVALKGQLGLMLETGRSPATVLVIDGVEQPSEN